MREAFLATAGLATGVLVAAMSAHAAPGATPPTTKAPEPPALRPPTKGASPEKRVTASIEGLGTPAGSVTWSYLKLNHPDVVVSALRDRQAGKLTAQQLRGLTAAEQGATRWADVRTTRPGAGKGAPLQTLGWGEVAKALASDPQIAPKTIDISIFGSGAVSRTVTGDCPQDGLVTVTLAGAPGFRIVKFADYDGTVSSSGGATTYTQWEAKTAAPFSMKVRAGQRFKVTVEYSAPLGAPKGDVKTNLVIKGTGWSSTVPLTAHLQGLGLGVPLIAGEDDFTFIADPTSSSKIALEVPIKVLNLNAKAFTGTLSGGKMPAGVSFAGAPVQVSFTKPEVKIVRTTLVIDPKVVAVGAGQLANFVFNFPGGQTSESVTMEALPTLRTWKWRATKDSETVEMSLVLGADGFNALSAKISSTRCGFWQGGNSSWAKVQGSTWTAEGIGPTTTSLAGWHPNGAAGWQKYATSKPSFHATWTVVCPDL